MNDHLNTTYYNQNAADFHANTAEVDMSALYQRFLPWLTKGAHIVDAGCGSGRDALAFHARGYQVSAFDASSALVAITQQRVRDAQADIDVQHSTFQSFQVETPVDAIWACASIQSLGKHAHLNKFNPEHFDYIVVDEFHHATARSYQALLAYFQPGFLLGLTATPERTGLRITNNSWVNTSMTTKSLSLALLAVILLSILVVEIEIWFGADLFYIWLGVISTIIAFAFGGFSKKS